MYIAIEGPIGVGKTTLARHLADHLNAELLLEVVEENPFLPLFYQDPQRYAFKVQVFFLLSRYKQLLPLSQPSLFTGAVVADYLFDKDYIFASLNLKDAEWELYADLYAHLSPKLPAPDLTIYLRAPVPVLLERIHRRGRPFEREISPEYLTRLTEAYDRHFERYPHPLWVLDNTEINYAENPADREWVAREVLQRVGQANL
ncbi:deoxynucleoside kinase [Marinithermus hydrothermalis]|uniref:Deoxynucleoside kinase n=1 Tax=Marinithermus hydrothermalis (strain DSM 14884 / JCM 11576 / T1) TaxID=869210 RepID=F2NM40_MARHT|nr:deoxynucleoside kinase [Marinithermus hydrothermalis]AEB11510.1 deoxynucleoside kinase [Marinithermus hydrothermalis DSM 14884]